MTILHLLWTI